MPPHAREQAFRWPDHFDLFKVGLATFASRDEAVRFAQGLPYAELVLL